MIDKRDLPGGAVDRGDLGVDPLADREAVGALLAAVARQLGFADEAGHAVGQHDLDAAVGDARDRAGDDLALLHACAMPASNGSASSCLMPRLMRSFSTSTSSTLTRTVSPLR